MVSGSLMRMMPPCWRPSVEGEDSSRGDDANGRVDGLLWYKDLGDHVTGEFSMAVIQANNLLEDHSQLESGPLSLYESGPHGTFVGIYDGHGGPATASLDLESGFVTIDDIHRDDIAHFLSLTTSLLSSLEFQKSSHPYVFLSLFCSLKSFLGSYYGAEFTTENGGMSADVINKAFLATEEDFLALVRKQWLNDPHMASVGSCCLVGIVCSGMLYIANAGDSRVVLGRLDNTYKEVKAVPLSSEHNASVESVREELRSLHPNDPQIVFLKHTVWRVKGIIQISRSIGDAYLKSVEFNRDPLLPKFRVPEPFDKPILSAEPETLVQKLDPEDQFLIFASDGLWEHLSSQEAVDIVNTCPRNKREMRYSDLKKIDRGVRRHFHDDITVIVLFLDFHLISQSYWQGPLVSIRGGVGVSGHGIC
ncbi:hypothetical protein Gogos_003836 [Gossypium gossypioides]|uniref:protein-serine/threonine phosphatase n=1 Tax=Gossypium gossypioides TaxID=34282 RepID=A0A7J9CP41_GOSGO|nr:hypothetical protein [Gossypium gossypioides]